MRDTTFDSGKFAEICARLANGQSLRKICADADMPGASTVRDWVRDDIAGCAEVYRRSRELGFEVFADEIIDLADDSSGDYVETGKNDDGTPILKLSHENVNRSRLRIDSRKWLLSKMLPKVYGDRVAAEVTGAGGAPLIPESVSSRDLARSVLAILREARIDDGADANADDDPDETDAAHDDAPSAINAAAGFSGFPVSASDGVAPHRQPATAPAGNSVLSAGAGSSPRIRCYNAESGRLE